MFYPSWPSHIVSGAGSTAGVLVLLEGNTFRPLFSSHIHSTSPVSRRCSNGPFLRFRRHPCSTLKGLTAHPFPFEGVDPSRSPTSSSNAWLLAAAMHRSPSWRAMSLLGSVSTLGKSWALPRLPSSL